MLAEERRTRLAFCLVIVLGSWVLGSWAFSSPAAVVVFGLGCQLPGLVNSLDEMSPERQDSLWLAMVGTGLQAYLVGTRVYVQQALRTQVGRHSVGCRWPALCQLVQFQFNVPQLSPAQPASQPASQLTSPGPKNAELNLQYSDVLALFSLAP